MPIPFKKAISFCLLLSIFIVACTGNYGKKETKDNIEVFYKDGVTTEEARHMADLLARLESSKDNKKRSVQLVRRGDTVLFRMVVDKEKAEKLSDGVFLGMASMYSDSIFKNAPVTVELTDDKLKTFRVIPFQKITKLYGEKATAGIVDVYCDKDFSHEHATAIATFINSLNKDGNTGKRKSFQASRDEDGTYILRMVADKEKASQLDDQIFYELATIVSDSAYQGAPVILELTDVTFIPYKRFPSGQ